MQRDFSRRIRKWHISFATSLPIFVVLAIGAYFLISPGIDHYRACTSPNDISRFRGIGIGANRTFSRIIQKPHDDIPVVVTPDAFNISLLMDQTTGIGMTSTPRKTTNLVWAWLQFVANDLVMTTPGSANDTLFSGTGVPEIIRSSFIYNSLNGNREQLNAETPYLDGSHIYGRDVLTAHALQKMDGTGKLNNSFIPSSPVEDAETPVYNETTGKFIGTDDRLNQNVLLTSLHVLFLREHNYWCDTLAERMPYLNEYELYNIARHIVVAEIQSITYREVVPLMLGIGDIDPSVCFSRPDDDHRTAVVNEFAVAAIRMGHSMITETLEIRDPYTGAALLPSVPVLEPAAPYVWNNGIGALLLGASRQQSQKRDITIVDALRMMVGPQDISRGRDHQLPSYQYFYTHFTGHSSVQCVDYAYNSAICDEIAALYGSPNAPIDLFLGLLIEKRVGSALVGIVGGRLIKYQFSHIKHSDHYFYLWDKVVRPFFAEIHNVRLSKIILRNTDISSFNLHPNVFLL